MTYRAVVKYPLDSTDAEKLRALKEGLGDIAMELVAEHGYEVDDLESAFEEAQGQGELELEMKRQRDAE